MLPRANITFKNSVLTSNFQSILLVIWSIFLSYFCQNLSYFKLLFVITVKETRARKIQVSKVFLNLTFEVGFTS